MFYSNVRIEIFDKNHFVIRKIFKKLSHWSVEARGYAKNDLTRSISSITRWWNNGLSQHITKYKFTAFIYHHGFYISTGDAEIKQADNINTCCNYDAGYMYQVLRVLWMGDLQTIRLFKHFFFQFMNKPYFFHLLWYL